MSLTFLFAIFGCQIFPIVVGQNTNTVFLAGIIDTTVFDWIPDVFEYTADRINTASISGAVLGVTDATVRQGLSEYGPNGLSLRYELANSKCDAATGVRQYWNVRTQNQVPHGVIGARCSGTSISLARITELERVPLLSPASNAAQLSSESEFPLFSRMVAPNDENGEFGALVELLRSFGWDRITILATDTQL